MHKRMGLRNYNQDLPRPITQNTEKDHQNHHEHILPITHETTHDQIQNTQHLQPLHTASMPRDVRLHQPTKTSQPTWTRPPLHPSSRPTQLPHTTRKPTTPPHTQHFKQNKSPLFPNRTPHTTIHTNLGRTTTTTENYQELHDLQIRPQSLPSRETSERKLTRKTLPAHHHCKKFWILLLLLLYIAANNWQALNLLTARITPPLPGLMPTRWKPFHMENCSQQPKLLFICSQPA